ncbi:MAG: TrkA family potassium uptake protein [Caldilineaceae bacterium]|nr:TrkA family potassium uptake protein [Caldilineaceae bacterium]
MRILVIGCGRMGAGLARRLEEEGHTLSAVDNDADALARLGSAFRGETVCGDGMSRDVLVHAGIGRADGLAAVTGSDEVNVVVARMARQIFHVPQVTARIYDPRKAEIYRRLGLATVAPVTWGIARMADSLTVHAVNAVLSLGSGAVEIVEVRLPPPLAGRTVGDITVPGEIDVVAVQRGGAVFLPDSATLLHTGDELYVAAVAGATPRLMSMLGTL